MRPSPCARALIGVVALATVISACASGPSRPAYPERNELRVSTNDLVADFRADPTGASQRWGAQPGRHYLVTGPLMTRSTLPGGPFDSTVLVTFGSKDAIASCYTLYSEGGPALFSWPIGKEVSMRTTSATYSTRLGAGYANVSLGSCVFVVP